MSPSYLLDSSILVALLRSDPAIQQKVSQGLTIFVPSIALGELYYGAFRSTVNTQHAIAQVDELVRTSSILVCDAVTAKVYGGLKQAQRTKGQMLPDNDLWIAAVAVQYALTLVGRDLHFTWVAGLTYEQW